MNKSESIKAISPALLKAQKAIDVVKKGATNPFYKSKYADLESIIDACKKPLNDNGISVLQSVGYAILENGAMKTTLETTLLHESGEWMSDTMIVAMDKEGPQAQGTAISYARRYSIQSFIFLPAEDDDAESATDRKKKPSSKKTTQQKSKKSTPKVQSDIILIADEQKKELEEIRDKLMNVADVGMLNGWLKNENNSYDGAIIMLERYRDKLKTQESK